MGTMSLSSLSLYGFYSLEAPQETICRNVVHNLCLHTDEKLQSFNVKSKDSEKH